jgi:hypothetical protein
LTQFRTLERQTVNEYISISSYTSAFGGAQP